MTIDIFCYKMKQTKTMNDNHFIDAGQKLIKIKEEDGLILFETYDNTSIKRIFWAKDDEVEFLGKKKKSIKKEDIEQSNREIFDNFI